ncbi:MAG: winged helix-turn-helix transcriptional regulator [Candidatus Delongbacteria bacterium]|nr:winged helix-turn-helix transcriptional regulator [Candidatus Delongbacteria bacterium]
MQTESLGFYLLRFSCLNRGILKKLASQVKLSITELRIMLAFTRTDEQTVSSIASCLSIQKGRVSPLVQNLFEMDIIRRHTSSEDRRVVFLYLTRKGERILEQISDDFERLFQDGTTRLTARQNDCMKKGMKVIIEMLMENEGIGPPNP